MKAILVIDNMPKTCGQCTYCITEQIENNTVHYCVSGKEGIVDIKDLNKKQTWCPLKPIPQKKEVCSLEYATDVEDWFDNGYNECIDEILGEEEK